MNVTGARNRRNPHDLGTFMRRTTIGATLGGGLSSSLQPTPTPAACSALTGSARITRIHKRRFHPAARSPLCLATSSQREHVSSAQPSMIKGTARQHGNHTGSYMIAPPLSKRNQHTWTPYPPNQALLPTATQVWLGIQKATPWLVRSPCLVRWPSVNGFATSHPTRRKRRRTRRYTRACTTIRHSIPRE